MTELTAADCSNCGVRLRLGGLRPGLPKVQCPACGFRLTVAAPKPKPVSRWRDPPPTSPLPAWLTLARWRLLSAAALAVIALQAAAIGFLIWRLAQPHAG